MFTDSGTKIPVQRKERKGGKKSQSSLELQF